MKQYALECSRIPMGQTVNSQVGASKIQTPAVRTPAPRVLPGFLTYHVDGKSHFSAWEDRKPGWIVVLEAWSPAQVSLGSWMDYEG